MQLRAVGPWFAAQIECHRCNFEAKTPRNSVYDEQHVTIGLDSVRLGDSPVVPVKTIPFEPSETSFLHSLQKVSVSTTPFLSKGVMAAVNSSPKWFMIIY